MQRAAPPKTAARGPAPSCMGRPVAAFLGPAAQKALEVAGDSFVWGA